LRLFPFPDSSGDRSLCLPAEEKNRTERLTENKQKRRSSSLLVPASSMLFAGFASCILASLFTAFGRATTLLVLASCNHCPAGEIVLDSD
jgi:hypothetical protein